MLPGFCAEIAFRRSAGVLHRRALDLEDDVRARRVGVDQLALRRARPAFTSVTISAALARA